MRWRRFAGPLVMGAAVLFATAAAAEEAAIQNGAATEAETILKRGYGELEAGDVDHAIADFDRTIRLSPDLALAYFFRGLAHFARDENEAAIADLERTTDLKSDWKVAAAIRWDIIGLVRAREPRGSIEPPVGDAPSMAIGRTHDCGTHFWIFSVLMTKPGEVRVRYDVSETGAIGNVAVVTSSGDVWMDRAAVICIEQRFRNTPAFKGGVAVASTDHEVVLRYDMPPPGWNPFALQPPAH